METLAQQFENFKASSFDNIVEEYLRNKPFVKEIKSIIGDYYKLALTLDKEAASIFIRYLNMSGQVIGFEYFDNKPVTVLSVYIPENQSLVLLKDIDVTVQRVVDHLAYKRFQRDSDSSLISMKSNFWPEIYQEMNEEYLQQQ